MDRGPGALPLTPRTREAQNPAIRLQGVSKRYWISTRASQESFPKAVRRLITGVSDRKPLWALKDVSLELKRGEILGLIGPNGAGKSTLLLLLARILGPTEGRVQVFGRTNLFFGLSSGLQSRLSVLDNFYVCAALLGLPRRRFLKLLPAIVEFAGLEKYLHAHFGELSSGLAARVAFSVAMHTDLDIILVDELLGVGDQAFREKCSRKFREFQERGKTMVLASHSMDIVASLCSQALFLNEGRVACVASPKKAIQRFLEYSGVRKKFTDAGK